MRSVLGFIAVAVLAGMPVVAPIPSAPAAVPIPADGEAGGEAGMISRAAVGRFGSLLGFSPTQMDAAKDLYDGYATSFKAAQRQDRVDRSHILAAAAADKSKNIAKELQDARSSHLAALEKLDVQLMSDLKALASEQQAASWPAVERARRRDQLIRGVISGESIDLFSLLDSLHLPPDVRSSLKEPLDAYELDLDRALQKKELAYKQDDPLYDNGEVSSRSVMNRTRRARVAGLEIRDINERYAAMIESALSGEPKARFHDAFRRAEFPEVLAPTYGTRALEAALKLTDLNESQRNSLEAVRARYAKDLDAANEVLIGAIRAAQTEQTCVIKPTEQGVLEVFTGPPEKSAVMRARKARSDLDTAVTDKLDSILTQAQLESLPPAKTLGNNEMVLMDDASFMVIRQ